MKYFGTAGRVQEHSQITNTRSHRETKMANNQNIKYIVAQESVSEPFVSTAVQISLEKLLQDLEGQ